MGYDFKVRAIELHSLYAWDFEWIMMTMDFIQAHNMNTLILHRNDFIDLIVYPGKYFGCSREKYDSMLERYGEIFRKLYKYTPTRRSSPYQRYGFLRRVLEEAKRRNIDIYIENKELYFPDIIIEFYPHLVKNGKICANDPFWWEFTRVKYKEFFEDFPDVAGIITAPATGESRVSIKSNRCECELCKSTKVETWFRNLLEAMYEPIHAAGKKLVVRDFVFDPQAQQEILSVIDFLPEDVVISLKNTPHDFYPTFPLNSRIGNVGNHEQWVEFDAMGQYFGWGIGIADLTEDYCNRFRAIKEKGASGIIVRTDWESLDGHSVFRTPNKINLYAAAAFSRNADENIEKIYYRFLEEEEWFEKDTDESQKRNAAKWFGSLFSKTWPVVKKTVYVNDCVFSDSSLSPVTLEHAFWLALEKNSLRDWVPSKWDAINPDMETLKRNLAEKDQALEEIEYIYNKSLEGCEGIRRDKLNYLQSRLFVNKVYVSFYRDITRAVLLAHYIIETEEERNSEFFIKTREMLDEAINRLHDLENKITEFYKTTSYRPHTIYTLLDPARVQAIRKDLTARINEFYKREGDKCE